MTRNKIHWISVVLCIFAMTCVYYYGGSFLAESIKRYGELSYRDVSSGMMALVLSLLVYGSSRFFLGKFFGDKPEE